MLPSTVLHQVPRRIAQPASTEMLPCLQRFLRPALSLRAGTRLATGGLSSNPTPATARLARGPPLSMLVQRRNLGTHPLKEPVEPLNSPRGAKEFIYSLHPSERTCLLRELHRFESIAIAQGRRCVYVSVIRDGISLLAVMLKSFLTESVGVFFIIVGLNLTASLDSLIYVIKKLLTVLLKVFSHGFRLGMAKKINIVC